MRILVARTVLLRIIIWTSIKIDQMARRVKSHAHIWQSQVRYTCHSTAWRTEMGVTDDGRTNRPLTNHVGVLCSNEIWKWQ